MENEKIKQLYEEFQGYLSQAPAPQSTTDVIGDESVWEQYNYCVDQLSKITGDDYKRFMITPISGYGSPFIRLIAYRQKLGGLISHLHGKYFPDDSPPFSGMPTTVINQSQQQNQSVQVQILLDIQSKIDAKMNQFKEGSNEKTFLQKLKGTLASISNISQLFNTIFTLANQNGISLETLSSIFK